MILTKDRTSIMLPELNMVPDEATFVKGTWIERHDSLAVTGRLDILSISSSNLRWMTARSRVDSRTS